MSRLFPRIATTLALAALPVASAQACWTEGAATAAKVREFETMLMVSTLRCRLSGLDMLVNYNDFIRESRPALVHANEALRRHFEPRGGLNAYDRYVTAIANRYGAGTEGLACRDMASILSAARNERGSYAGLTRLAEAAGTEPELPGGLCVAPIASR